MQILTACFLCSALLPLGESIKPVIMFHGLLDDHFTMDTLRDRINKDFPGPNIIHSLDLFPNDLSLIDLSTQAEVIKRAIIDLKLEGDITFIGYSMGGLTGRYLIENWSEHPITTFISLAGPQIGVCMIPPDSQKYFHGFTNETVAILAYNELGQTISVLNMWNDPIRQDRYLQGNTYLPPSLCQNHGNSAVHGGNHGNSTVHGGNHGNSTVHDEACQAKRRNLARLKKWMLVGGPQDGTVEPWQSSLMGYYDKDWNIVPRHQQSFYPQLGLDLLEEHGVLVQCQQDGVEHHRWPHNATVYEQCIRPHIS